MHLRVLQYGVLTLAAGLALAACGGGSGSASAAGTTTTVKGPAGAGQPAALRDCLKQHGVTLPAGFGGGNGPPPSGATPGSFPPGGPRGSLPAGVDAQKLQSAFQACGGARGGFPGGGFAGGRNRQAFQAYTACLSDHGVKVPKRTALSTPPTFDRNSSVFVAANKVCATLLPAASPTTTTPSN
jgi:hypothetical protein